MPDEAKALCDGAAAHGSDRHKQLIKATVPYVVDIARHAHVSPLLKANLRRLLGLGPAFTLNLGWAGAWDDLQRGCSEHMRALGDQLNTLFTTQDLRTQLGTYDPLGDGGDGSQAAASPKASSSSPPPHLVQYIPAQCAPEKFGSGDPCKDNDLERTYIHFLRLLALALDHVFQQTVNDKLEAAGVRLVGGGASSGGIKGYERMANKMLSRDDHRDLPKPRPAHNIDVVRCLATFDTVDDMRKGFDVL